MKTSKIIILALATAFAAKAFSAEYSVIDRYSVKEDRFKTEEMLRPYGHDFIIDINAAMSDGLQDLADGVEKVSKSTNQLTDAQTFLAAEKNNEHMVRLHLEFGVPIFQFTAWGVKIVPDFRFGANFGANLGIKSNTLTIDNILDLVGEDVPAALGTAIRNNFNSYSAGDNLINNTICTNAGIATGAGSPCQALIDKNYKYPSDTSIPDLFVFTKLDVKAGFLFNYFKDNWFGHVNLYGLHRTDFLVRINADSMTKDDVFDGADELNSQVSLNLDYKLGYKTGRYRVWGELEEVKISTMSDNIAKGGDLKYGNDMLIRVHGDAKFSYSAFTLTPFVGIHKRSHYDLSEGYYGGADFGAYFWGDRLGLRFRTMIDPEHITLAPQFKLWLMQLEYAFKAPIASDVDGTKVAGFNSINFRMFF